VTWVPSRVTERVVDTLVTPPLTALIEPLPRDWADLQRWSHTRLRRRILYGLWIEDLRVRVRDELRSEERAESWGTPDLTCDLLGPVCKALSSLYTPEPPRVGGKRATTQDDGPRAPLGPVPAGGQPIVDAVAAGGLWDLMIRGQRDTIGMREWAVRVDPVPDPSTPTGWGLAFRPAFADRIVATPRPDALDLPLTVRELVQLQLPGDRTPQWYWDVWDATPEAPRHAIETDTGYVVLEEAGDQYPYRDEYGRPTVPYSLYHAERTGALWDAWEWLALVEACLRVGVLWTFFGHLIRNASWPQRYMAGAFVAADTDGRSEDGITTTRERARTVADPARVLYLEVAPDATGQPLIGAFPVGSQPDVVADAIEKYERRATNLAGLDPASVQKVSGDPRSGYAISVSMEQQGDNRRRFAPAFRRGDLETIRVSAAILSSVAGVTYPGAGYDLAYGPADEAEGSQPRAQNAALATAITAIVTEVAAGKIPRDAAVQILQTSFGLDGDEADALVGSAGKTFKVTPPAPPAFGGADGGGNGDGAPGPPQQGDRGAGGSQGGTSGAP
jgi:hypothetical protein